MAAPGLDLRLGVRRRPTAWCQGNINRLVAAQNERAGADLRPAARFTLDLGPGDGSTGDPHLNKVIRLRSSPGLRV